MHIALSTRVPVVKVQVISRNHNAMSQNLATSYLHSKTQISTDCWQMLSDGAQVTNEAFSPEWDESAYRRRDIASKRDSILTLHNVMRRGDGMCKQYECNSLLRKRERTQHNIIKSLLFTLRKRLSNVMHKLSFRVCKRTFSMPGSSINVRY